MLWGKNPQVQGQRIIKTIPPATSSGKDGPAAQTDLVLPIAWPVTGPLGASVSSSGK